MESMTSVLSKLNHRNFRHGHTVNYYNVLCRYSDKTNGELSYEVTEDANSDLWTRISDTINKLSEE